MKTTRHSFRYNPSLDHEILEAYLNKTSAQRRSDARRIKRALHKITAH